MIQELKYGVPGKYPSSYQSYPFRTYGHRYTKNGPAPSFTPCPVPQSRIYKAKAPNTANPITFPNLPTSTLPFEAAPDDVGDEAATWLVTVSTVAGIVEAARVEAEITLTTVVVVPPTTLGEADCDPCALCVTVVPPATVSDTVPVAEIVVPPNTVSDACAALAVTVVPPTTTTSVVVWPAIVVAGIVDAGIVVVYVTTCPKAVAGIALPTPAEV